jgi:antitoxin ParD1/3/4
MKSRAEMLAALDEALARGLADCDAGRVLPMDVVFARLQARYENLVRLREATPAMRRTEPIPPRAPGPCDR